MQLGITLAELTQQLSTEKRLTGVRGLYVKDVDPNGLAAEVRLPSGTTGPRRRGRNHAAEPGAGNDARRLSARFGRSQTGRPVVLHVATYSGRSNA